MGRKQDAHAGPATRPPIAFITLPGGTARGRHIISSFKASQEPSKSQSRFDSGHIIVLRFCMPIRVLVSLNRMVIPQKPCKNTSGRDLLHQAKRQKREKNKKKPNHFGLKPPRSRRSPRSALHSVVQNSTSRYRVAGLPDCTCVVRTAKS